MLEGIESLTQANVDEFIANNNGIIIFHKTLCPHCKVMGVVLGKVHAQNSSIKIAAIDTEEESALMEKFGVERVPTLVVFKNGEKKASNSGIMNPKETIAFFAKA
ncbi:thioredoxin family protein [Desulfovibrio litoralis]|uniref:Thioredoxin n=1 Tax=Desulfovibrio litoralis DSM 11393 TaxID=1121455 RepID=A0A1M7SMN7_9BACT|nr:thioredoxin family protein [Desulfovibrio litoralis]SHN59735.1 thioredoxin [Desulfovibrio litoralis DSM 11393]